MFTTIKKRDGRVVDFTESKITEAIFKAAQAVGGEDKTTAMELTLEVLKYLKNTYGSQLFSVEDVQDAVEKILIEKGHARTAKAYILYRAHRNRIREAKGELMDAVEEILVETNRENANISNSPSAKMLQIASAASKKYYLSRLIPEELALAHTQGDMHIHDLDFYGKTLTCLQIPLKKLLTEGFNNGHGFIRPPKRPASATALAAIILQSCQNDMHGGQSFPFFDSDIASFVKDADEDETYQAMEAFIYNLNSMHSLSGDEHIWVYDKHQGKFGQVSMREFDETFEEGRYQALSLNYETGKTELKDIIATIKHKNVHRLLNVRLKSGQSVTVTENHSVMALDRLGRVTVAVPEELKSGLLPKKIDFDAQKAVFDLSGYPYSRKHPLEKLELTPALAKFMGYYVAEGSVDGSTIFLAIFNEVIERDVDSLLQELKPTFHTRLRFNKAGKPRDLACNVGRTFAAFIGDACGRGAANKRIPTELFFAAPEIIRAFMDGYFSGDGTAGPNKIAAGTVSKELRDGLQLLCARLNIPVSFREDRRPKTNFATSRPRYLISIGGIYARDIALTGKDTAHLNRINFEQTQYDYEWLRPLIKEVYGIFGWASTRYRITPDFINNLINDLETRLKRVDMAEVKKLACREYLLEVINRAALNVKTTERYHLLQKVKQGVLPSGTKYFPALADYAAVLDSLYLPHNRGDFRIKNTEQSPRAVIRWANLVLEQIAKMRELLAILKRCTQLLPVRVKKITECPHEEYVYDISVADNENFLTAEGIFVHNSRAGAQVPFSSLNVGTDTSPEARKVVRNLLLAYEKGLGRGENPIFPNIIFRVKEGINLNEGDPNYDLFKLAIRVASRRLNPTFSFMDSSFNRRYGTDISYMGCRTRVMGNVNGPEITEGRGNLSFTTINLPRVAIKSGTNIDKFYRELDRVLETAIAQLIHRYKVQAGLKVKDMPFLMGQGLYIDSENLKPCDEIEPAIKHGTLSVGFIGLAETLKCLMGKHHGESADAQELGLQIVEFMRKKMDDATEEHSLNFTLLATPAEGLSGRFVRYDRREYGVIPGVTDKTYYSNSFHVPVGYDINIYNKVSIEGPYHKFCNAGHISYVEFSSPPIHNLEAIEDVIRHMKASDIGYAGINFPVDFCMSCSYIGVINKDECPMCNSAAIKRVRRITGYLSTVDRFNDAKQAELNDRIPHRLLERE